MARHLWGVPSSPDAALPRFSAMGYRAIEAPMPDEPGPLVALLAQNGLEYIGMAFTGGDSVKAHVESFRTQIGAAIKAGARQVTAHTGRDDWSMADCRQFYREISAVEADLPISVAHETHRGRAFYNPWTTRDLLLEFPAIKLCCDFSHWVCVAERLSWDDASASILQLCASRVIHTHTRVGYEEGPQVPDPAAPEYSAQLNTHLDWWKTLWLAQKQRGDAVCTVTPEFGPPGYMHTLPYTNAPVADLQAVCEWTTQRVKEVFNSYVV